MMGPWSGKRVLVVDDSTLVQESNQAVFENLGMSIAGVANNGVVALEKYRQLKPDIVSLDIIMPEMHGIDCYNLMLSEDPNLHIMFISCLSAPHIIGESILEVIPRELFVPKPASPEGVIQALEVLFGIKEPRSLPPQPPAEGAENSGPQEPPDPPTTGSQTLLTPPDEAS